MDYFCLGTPASLLYQYNNEFQCVCGPHGPPRCFTGVDRSIQSAGGATGNTCAMAAARELCYKIDGIQVAEHWSIHMVCKFKIYN